MDIRSRSMRSFIDRMAKKYDMDNADVIRILHSQFSFVKEKMKKVDSYNSFFPYVRLPYLGVFKILPGKQKYLKEKSKKKLEDAQTES